MDPDVLGGRGLGSRGRIGNDLHDVSLHAPGESLQSALLGVAGTLVFLVSLSTVLRCAGCGPPLGPLPKSLLKPRLLI